MLQKDVSTDSFKVLTPMPNASHTLSYSLYINLNKIILLKLGFVFVMLMSLLGVIHVKKKLPSAKSLVKSQNCGYSISIKAVLKFFLQI